MRFCELLLTSLKMGNSCHPSVFSVNRSNLSKGGGHYVLSTSESKNLDRERRNKAGRDLDEVYFTWWYHPFQRIEVTHDHYQDEVCYKRVRDSARDFNLCASRYSPQEKRAM
jgi:hypothetical protein